MAMHPTLEWLVDRVRTRDGRIRALGGDPRLGTLGSYTKLRLLGQSESSQVYLAAPSESLRRAELVALKLLLLPDADRERRQAQVHEFFREVHLLRKLKHPNLVRLVDVFEDMKAPYLAREYVDGKTLAQVLRERAGGLPMPEWSKLARTLLEALAYAHQNRVLHRGLTPDNLMLASGELKVMNFGLARPVDFNGRTVYGTPGYIPPEILSGASTRPDATHDQYAVGLVLFEALTGRAANPGSTPRERLQIGAEHGLLQATELGARGDWLARLTAREPYLRFPSLELALDELVRIS